MFTKIDKEISGDDEDEGFFRFSREGLPVEKSWTEELGPPGAVYEGICLK